MAWWTTQFVFRDDRLIAEGVDPVALNDYQWVGEGEKAADDSDHYTRVVVSGYALYGELRGYYALGVAHWQVEPAGGRVHMSEHSRGHSEPVSSLTAAQRAIVRECLIDLNPAAWENSHPTFRRKLERQETK